MRLADLRGGVVIALPEKPAGAVQIHRHLHLLDDLLRRRIVWPDGQRFLGLGLRQREIIFLERILSRLQRRLIFLNLFLCRRRRRNLLQRAVAQFDGDLLVRNIFQRLGRPGGGIFVILVFERGLRLVQRVAPGVQNLELRQRVGLQFGRRRVAGNFLQRRRRQCRRVFVIAAVKRGLRVFQRRASGLLH